VTEYDKYCPVSMGSEVIADRWTPLIVRELILGSTRFNDIARGLPGISRSLLVQRLGHLERKGVIERWPSPGGRGNEYHLTPAGKDLEGVVMALGRWSIEWLFHELHPHDVDARTLTWWLHHRVDHAQLPPGRTVIQIDHTAPERIQIWIVLDRGVASVCMHHPGFDSDLVVTCPTPALADVFSGRDTWRRAVDSGDIGVEGPPQLARALPRWFMWSPFAPDVRDRMRRRDEHDDDADLDVESARSRS
jgi:DNA-binding HxlR family transcriptional regulator